MIHDTGCEFIYSGVCNEKRIQDSKFKLYGLTTWKCFEIRGLIVSIIVKINRLLGDIKLRRGMQRALWIKKD